MPLIKLLNYKRKLREVAKQNTAECIMKVNLNVF